MEPVQSLAPDTRIKRRAERCGSKAYQASHSERVHVAHGRNRWLTVIQ